MARVKMTEEERVAKKKAAWAKIVAGRPNPDGIIGSPDLWADIAATITGKLGKMDFTREQTGDALLDIFGFKKMPTLAELKTARARLLLHEGIHPDRGGSAEMTRKVLAAYEQLKRKIELAGRRK